MRSVYNIYKAGIKSVWKCVIFSHMEVPSMHARQQCASAKWIYNL
jgi:hypothetical protein